MNGRWLAAIVIVLVAVFSAISLSVVDSRRPLARAVEDSFEARMSQLAAPGRSADPLGCSKARVNYYDCPARLTLRGLAIATTVRYELALTDDGCWTATPIDAAVPLPPSLAGPHGCFTT